MSKKTDQRIASWSVFCLLAPQNWFIILFCIWYVSFCLHMHSLLVLLCPSSALIASAILLHLHCKLQCIAFLMSICTIAYAKRQPYRLPLMHHSMLLFLLTIRTGTIVYSYMTDMGISCFFLCILIISHRCMFLHITDTAAFHTDKMAVMIRSPVKSIAAAARHHNMTDLPHFS